MPAESNIPSFDELREEALRRLRESGRPDAENLPADVKSLVYELQTHQVELEVQNEHLRHAAQSLAQAHRKHQDLFENAPVGYLTLDAGGKIQRANIAASRLCNQPRRALAGRRIESILAPDDRDQAYRMLRQVDARKTRQSCEVGLVDDEKTTWVRLEAHAIVEADPQNPGGFRVTMTDITDRVQVAQSHQQQAQRLELALAGARIGLWDYDLVGGGMYWGRILYELLGRDPDQEVSQETFFGYIHPDDRQRVRDHADRWLVEGGEFRDEFRVIREDGQVRWFAAVGKRVDDDQGRTLQAIGVNFDVTESKQNAASLAAARDELEDKVLARTTELERTVSRLREEVGRRELAEEILLDRTVSLGELNEQLARRTELLHELSRKLATAEDRERKRLADLLHDQMQQVLVGVRFQLETAAGRTENTGVLAAIETANELLGEAIDTSRLLSQELSPPLLHEQGLGPALRWLVGRMRHIHGLEVTLGMEGDLADLPAFVAGLVYRAAREMLFNVVKHAGVNQAELTVTREAEQMEVVVEDKGAGCDDLVPENFGRGLLYLHERTDAIGGEMKVRSAAGEGCRVAIRIPPDALDRLADVELD